MSAILFHAPSAAHAEEDAAPSSRPYVVRLAGSVGIPLELADSVEQSRAYRMFDEFAGTHTTDEPSIGFHGALGYRFLDDHVSLSAHVEHLSNLEVTFDDGVRGSPESGRSILEGDTWSLSADLAIYPWTGRVQPFLLAGLGWLWADLEEQPVRTADATPGSPDPGLVKLGLGIDSGDDLMARFGAGVEFYLTDYFFLHADASYVLGTGEVDDLDYISVGWGLGCRF
jgi:hypothetical protein